MDKAPDAFRTISEVADDLDVPAHVLRFWETRFVQIKPMKRSGGRRYYRPDDVDLLRGIRRLLYGEGYTIRGVQRILREHGIKAVQGMADEASLAPSPLAGPAFNGAEKAGDRRAAPGDDDAADDAPDDIQQDIQQHDIEGHAEGRHAQDDSDSGDLHAGDDADDDPVLSGVAVRPSRAAMDFVPSSSERLAEPGMARSAATRAAQSPVRSAVMPPADPAPVRPVANAPAWSGVEAYAPPKIRNGMRSGDRSKLQAVLDELIDARELIDRALGNDSPDSQE